jgi:energy-coupling factor transport system ATP-binding protein
MGTIALIAAALAPLAAASAVGALYALAGARKLAFSSLQASLAGAARLAQAVGLPHPVAAAVNDAVATLLRAWPLVTAVVVLIVVPIGMLGTHMLVVLVARRVEWMSRADPLATAGDARAGASLPIAPLPARFAGVAVQHGSAAVPALADIELRIDPGEFVAVVGPNGAGKSTLVTLLAGAAPTSGRVERPGRVGLGLPGGTAIVTQRPEAQILGSNVLEDLYWGLPAGSPLDAAEVLAMVGLSGLQDVSTESLSGGQLQRLALAAALARNPALLISDESTAMLDPAGRSEILELLAELPARTGASVVHVTHDIAEAARADRVINLAAGRVIDVAPGTPRVETTGSPDGKSAPMGLPAARTSPTHTHPHPSPWPSAARRRS